MMVYRHKEYTMLDVFYGLFEIDSVLSWHLSAEWP